MADRNITQLTVLSGIPDNALMFIGTSGVGGTDYSTYMSTVREKVVGDVFSATSEPTGFTNRTDSTISWVSSPASFSIQPSVTSFEYWISGIKHTITTTKTTTFDGAIAEGIWYIYFDENEDIQVTQTFADTIFSQGVWIATGYYDNTSKTWMYTADERHGITMDSQTHTDLHFSFGTTYQQGLSLGNFTIEGGAPTGDAAAQFTYAEGIVRDEDIKISISGSATPATMPVFYHSGLNAQNVWRRQNSSNIPTIYNSGLGLLSYNQLSGSAWQQGSVGNNNYVLSHIFATNDPYQPVISVQGQNYYGTVVSARAGSTTELKNLLTGGLPFVEYTPLATVIYYNSTTYASNAKHCKVVEYETGYPYVDWRKTTKTGVGGLSISDHNSLASIQGGTSQQYYHLDAEDYGFASSLDQNIASTDNVKFATIETTSGIITHSGIDFVPKAANPGGVSTVWINQGNGHLMRGTTDIEDAGTAYDQSLNTTDNVRFNIVEAFSGIIAQSGIDLTPKASNPGGTNTIWVRASDNHLMRGSTDVEAGGTASGQRTVLLIPAASGIGSPHTLTTDDSGKVITSYSSGMAAVTLPSAEGGLWFAVANPATNGGLRFISNASNYINYLGVNTKAAGFAQIETQNTTGVIETMNSTTSSLRISHGSVTLETS